MPTNRITMRRIRETLRLHLQAKLSYTEVGRALKISKSVVGKYVSLARAADVDWERAQSLSDDEEYARDNPLAYKYTSFCIKYRAFAATQQRSMRQIHIAGEKLFVDYAGGAVPIIDAATGEIT